MKYLRIATMVLISSVLATGVGIAAGGNTEKKASAPPDEAAMMAAWQKAATPGDHHKLLEPMAGTWVVKITSWMAPGAPPLVSSGTSENSWVLGGRFLQQIFKGSLMDTPFDGIGYTGYDNVKGMYVGTWMDTMGTMILNTTGTGDATGKGFTLSGTYDDCLTKKPCTMRMVLRVVDHDHHTNEMYGPDPATGKEYKMMEIAYTRK